MVLWPEDPNNSLGCFHLGAQRESKNRPLIAIDTCFFYLFLVSVLFLILNCHLILTKCLCLGSYSQAGDIWC